LNRGHNLGVGALIIGAALFAADYQIAAVDELFEDGTSFAAADLAEVGCLAAGYPAVGVHELEDHLLALNRLDPGQSNVLRRSA
jgi:hypothetical protein